MECQGGHFLRLFFARYLPLSRLSFFFLLPHLASVVSLTLQGLGQPGSMHDTS